MRNYKFRAWDRKNKVMLKITTVDFSNGICFSPSREKYLDFWNYDTAIMQSTELKDRNGNEIYEGDILEDEEGFYIVRFDEKRGAYVLDVYGVSGMMLESGWNETAGEFKIVETLQFDDFYTVPKVIGNIYENGELINR